MTCLLNYIGIKGCGVIPTSGKYINQLAGMTTELVDNIATTDQVTYLEAWKDIQAVAYDKLRDDVVNEVRKNQNFLEVIYQTKRLTRFGKNNIVVPAGPEFRGNYYKIPESRYTELYLRELYVYSDRAVETTCKVFDLNDGSELFSKDITLTVGFNVIDIEYTVKQKYGYIEVFAGVDCTLFQSIKTEPEYFYDMDGDECGCNYNENGFFDLNYASVGITDIIDDKVQYQVLDHTGNGSGITFGAEIKCSIDAFICENKKNLENAWMMLLAFQTLYHKLGSFRTNLFTASNLEQTAQLRTDYERQYISCLKNVIKNIPVSDICLNCDDTLEVYTGGSIA